MNEVFSTIIDATFLSLIIEMRDGVPTPAISFGFRIGSTRPPQNLPLFGLELTPDIKLRYNCDLDNINMLKRRGTEGNRDLTRLPVLHFFIDPRLPDYLHQLHPTVTSLVECETVIGGQSPVAFIYKFNEYPSHPLFSQIVTEYQHILVRTGRVRTAGSLGLPDLASCRDPMLGSYRHKNYVVKPSLGIGFTHDLSVIQCFDLNIFLRPTYLFSITNTPRRTDFGIMLDPQYNNFLNIYHNEAKNFDVGVRPSVNCVYNTPESRGSWNLRFDFTLRQHTKPELNYIELGADRVMDRFAKTLVESYKHPELNIKDFQFEKAKIKLR